MSYYIAKTVSGPFDRVLGDVTARLKAQGFGVLSDIDVQATLKAKIGADMPKYRILGACNPQFAHEALKIEDKLGVLLPCNVIVREASDTRIEVAAVDPVSSMERTGNPALRSTAEEVRRLLSNAISAVGTITLHAYLPARLPCRRCRRQRRSGLGVVGEIARSSNGPAARIRRAGWHVVTGDASLCLSRRLLHLDLPRRLPCGPS